MICNTDLVFTVLIASAGDSPRTGIIDQHCLIGLVAQADTLPFCPFPIVSQLVTM